MWGRFPRCDSDSKDWLPGSSHHRDWPHPQEARTLRHGSASSQGNQVASWRGPGSAYQEEGRRRSSADHTRAPSPCPPSSAPTHSEALDFHCKTPPIYPHWCSLCDVTVMSEKVSLKGRSFWEYVCVFFPHVCWCVCAGVAPAHQWDPPC